MEARSERKNGRWNSGGGSEKSEGGVYGDFEKEERATEELITMEQDRPAGKTAGYPNTGDESEATAMPPFAPLNGTRQNE